MLYCLQKLSQSGSNNIKLNKTSFKLKKTNKKLDMTEFGIYTMDIKNATQ